MCWVTTAFMEKKRTKEKRTEGTWPKGKFCGQCTEHTWGLVHSGSQSNTHFLLGIWVQRGGKHGSHHFWGINPSSSSNGGRPEMWCPRQGRGHAWGWGLIRQDPEHNGAGSQICVCSECETIRLHVSEMPFPRAFSTWPTPVHSLIHMAPTACQAPRGHMSEFKTMQRGNCSLEAWILGRGGRQWVKTHRQGRGRLQCLLGRK